MGTFLVIFHLVLFICALSLMFDSSEVEKRPKKDFRTTTFFKPKTASVSKPTIRYGIDYSSTKESLPSSLKKPVSRPITANAMAANDKELFALYEKIKRRAAEAKEMTSKKTFRE